MTQGRGNKANDLLQTDFRRANAPAQRNARAGDPSPLDSQRAHPFTKDDVAQHIASHLDADDLADWEAIVRMVRG